MREFEVDPEASTVVIDARSTVGPIAWESTGATGWFAASLAGDGLDLGVQPSGHLELPIATMTSGNRVYDSELNRRV